MRPATVSALCGYLTLFGTDGGAAARTTLVAGSVGRISRRVLVRSSARAALLCAAALAWTAASGRAQTISYPHPPSYRPDPTVDSVFAPWDSATTPGCALGVVRDGRFLYERGYGMANLDYDVPNTTRMVYYIGSDSKQFTAASIALLSLQGRLSLDDDIRRYIPEMPDYGTPVTISELVHHTSGIRDIYTLMALAGLRLQDVFPDSAALALIARQRELNFRPDTDYLYSNSGYWLLAEIVKRVTGESLRVYADSAIFRPLGMSHTHFHDMPGHVMRWRAMSYEREPRGGFRISYLQNFDKIGAGGLYSTVEDLQKWDENYYTHRVGGDALQEIIHRRGVLANGDTLPYAFGNEISTYRGLPVEEHGGSMMGYKAYILRFPTRRFSVIETCNLGDVDPGALAHRVADVYLADVLGARAARTPRGSRRPARDTASWNPTPADLSPFAGDYYSDELDVTYHLAVKGDSLRLSYRATPERALRPRGGDTFRVGPVTLSFHRDASGKPTGFEIEAGRVRHVRFERR